MGLIFAMPGNAPLAARISALSGWSMGAASIRRFPDGESYVRIDSEVAGRDAAILCTLARPDARFLPLVFTARLLKELGARKVVLIAPYLAYLRQDRRFRDGEALTSAAFASLLGREVDALVTVAPHLHRIHALGEIYGIPAAALDPAPVLAEWIRAHLPAPLIVGPDGESGQWVREIGRLLGAPHVVFAKRRSGDRRVEIVAPDLAPWQGRSPVLVDDIVSSGATMRAAALRLAEQGFAPPICLVVHPIFGRGAVASLTAAGCRIVSSDTVAHPTNGISVAPLLAAGLAGIA
jgi:ribose-phosphate pyrophosphokinase